MKVEFTAFGRNAKRSLTEACGSIRMRADTMSDAEFLAVLQRVIQYPQVLSVLLEIGEAIIDKKLSTKERKALADMTERVVNLKRAKGGA